MPLGTLIASGTKEDNPNHNQKVACGNVACQGKLDYDGRVIDFAARLDELYDFLNREYGVGSTDEDRDAIDMIAAASIIIPGARRSSSLILETDWLSLHCRPAWFAFGGAIVPQAIGQFKRTRIRYASSGIKQMTEEADRAGRPVVFVEPEWRVPRKWTKIRSGSGVSVSEAFQECLHIKVKSPKTLSVLQVDPHGAEARATRLRYLFCQVTESDLRPKQPASVVIPPHFAYYCEVALKLVAARGVAWEWLTNAVAGVAMRNAVLYGRTDTNEDDWRIAGRALAWQVAPWTAGLLAAFEDHWIAPYQLRLGGWRERVGPEAGMLELQDVKAEIVRLASAGVLQKVDGQRFKRGFVDEQTRAAVRRVLAGRAFVID